MIGRPCMTSSTNQQRQPQWRWHERVALALYGGLMWAARPLLRRKLAARATSEPGYAHDVPARFGQYVAGESCAKGLVVWVHAVSLGETRAATMLIAALRAQLPGMRLLLTHGTATGRAEGQRLLQPGDWQTWLPWDDPCSARRFFRFHAPAVGVLMETEIWPTLLAQASAARVPMVLANARLNERSARGALRLSWLSRPAYANFTLVGAQTKRDASRLEEVGVRAPMVWGNVKFDARPDPDQQAKATRWRHQLGRPVILLASSREGEELAFLRQMKDIPLLNKEQCAIENIIFLVVPRHPQRFDEVAEQLQAEGVRVMRRAQWGASLDSSSTGTAKGWGHVDGHTLWLGDSMGEMVLYASLADVALLGGSFQPLGGQNLIELAACGCTVVAGPHTFNFEEATEQALEAGVAHRVADMAAGLRLACQLVTPTGTHAEDSLAESRRAAREWAEAHQGAVQRATQAIVALLNDSGD